MANIEGSGMGGSKQKPLSKLEQQGYVQQRPPAYTPPATTYSNPAPVNNPPPVNNTAQQQAMMFAAQQEAERRAREEAARRAQEEAARQAALAAQQEAERRAREEAARRAQEEAARQAAIAAQRAQEERDRQAALAAQQQRDRLNAIVSQQKSTYDNKKLEQINTSPTNKQSATYYWNAANVPTKYVNPVVANEISKANANIDRLEELKKWRRPPSTDVNQVGYTNPSVSNLISQANANIDRLEELKKWRRPPSTDVTPGLANVEKINIPASSAAPAASTVAPLPTAAAYPEMYRYRTTNLNTAGYTSTAPAAGTIEKSAGTANEAAIPKGAKRSRPSYGQSTQVVKAPYRVGGYTEAELKAMGNEARKDLVGPDGSMLFEGYYKAPDGNYYPVDQGKANYALARGMTDPSQYWYYYGYTPDKEAYRNVYGTYYGYTPSWRDTGARLGGSGSTHTYAPSGSTGAAYGAGFSGQPVGQQRYFNPVVNWSY